MILWIICVAWGGLAFGAVYPWAYWPLACGIAAVGSAGLFRSRGLERNTKVVAAALVIFATSAVVQLIPLRIEQLEKLSPETIRLLTELVPGFPFSANSHSITISPQQTIIALAWFVALSVLMTGGAATLSGGTARTLAVWIAVVGVAMAVVGIVQHPLYDGRIYGFWSPEAKDARPFGPFVNRNHYAGWMLMAIPLTLGVAYSFVDRNVRRPLAHRGRWLSLLDESATAIPALLVVAVGVMTIAVMFSLSRSGMVALTAVFVLALGCVVWNERRPRRKVAALLLLSVIIAIGVAIADVNAVRTRFAEPDTRQLGARVEAWHDATSILRRFLLVGTGLNTYGVSTIVYQQRNRAYHYQQAHNDYLQLAVEGGLLLTIPAVLCVGALSYVIHRRLKEESCAGVFWLRTGAAAGILAVALQEFVDFSLQLPGNAVLFATVCAIAIHNEKREDGLADER